MGAPETIPPPQSVKTAPPVLKLRVDDNAGIYDRPRKTPEGAEDGWFFTNNFYTRLFYQPSSLLGKRAGLFANLSMWIRTTDSDPTYSKSVMRFFAGPIFYVRPVDNNHVMIQTIYSPNFFAGFDLNQPETKDFSCVEFGNYGALEFKVKKAGLTFNGHTWWVEGLDINLPNDTEGQERGFILGATILWSPNFKTGFFPLDNASFYAQYQRWIWSLVPEGIGDPPFEKWNQFTFGLQSDIPVLYPK